MRGSSLQTFALAVSDVAPRVSAATANSDFFSMFFIMGSLLRQCHNSSIRSHRFGDRDGVVCITRRRKDSHSACYTKRRIVVFSDRGFLIQRETTFIFRHFILPLTVPM